MTTQVNLAESLFLTRYEKIHHCFKPLLQSVIKSAISYHSLPWHPRCLINHQAVPLLHRIATPVHNAMLSHIDSVSHRTFRANIIVEVD